MNIDLDQLNEGQLKDIIAALLNRELRLNKESPKSLYENFIGKYCIIRTYSAGVHVGVVVQQEGTIVELKDAKRIWRWEGANTLHEISLHGLSSGSKLSEEIPTILLTEAVETIPCSQKAKQIIRDTGWGR